MLMQSIDYYDYIAKNIEGFSRLLSSHRIDPTQKPRILLIAPSFSQQTLARAKWISVPISLFRYEIISIGNERIPIFSEEKVEAPPVAVEEITSAEQHVAYIKDEGAARRAKNLIQEFLSLDKNRVSADPIKNAISFKYALRSAGMVSTSRRLVLAAIGIGHL